ncbi:RagB/SusD family nutrient uptake outer membrane protein [Sinomicrobium weinanense]|uniref:RagB/SusD family nutrient uptake outer membrane protein n=1 Tax=Sinomicrobium weinanense TaxID=2842200 RepID=A0A926Q2G5_9FLAO|nr:RagB/SusD family nutrient uptake outer membrane protein [Sinomicrobium weinanense]MBC9796627.1 RagB/SusD family nutrient uptake outer membrane protein [Sinomicrobium weinanense]MBU3123849.1 RagB/SusD family nutrient uptake outer membrane protein [Sinomicrobium weinanense]
MKFKYIIVYSLIAATGLLVSCGEDFLERAPLSETSAENFYQTSEDLRLATAALYGGGPWADWNYNCYLPVGDVLSGNMAVGYWGDAVQLNTFSVTGLNEIMIANWKSMYKVIAHCNITINAIQEKAPPSIPEEDRNAAIAEARFIRGFAYYNLALLWGDVPIIEDNIGLIGNPLVYRNKVNDVYRFAVNDLTFAENHLPDSDTKGRLTTWSAQGMLAKVYLTWAGLNSEGSGQRDQALLDKARSYAGNVCKNSGLMLLDDYANLFKTGYNDNQESLFALQWAPGLGWLEGNMLQVYSPGGTEISANGQAGWFNIEPTIDMYALYTEQDSIRRKATFMLRGDYYPELNAAGGGFTFDSHTGLKKHIIGTNVDNNAPTMTLTSSTEHNSLLRLADVYLLYAEAILGNNAATSDGDALFYFNEVRIRAGLDPVASIDADILLKERRVELAAEGQFWNDLVRLSYYDPQKAIDILNNEQRVPFDYEDGTATPRDPYGEITPATVNTFRFPLPSSEITANPKLLEPPVSYSF